MAATDTIRIVVVAVAVVLSTFVGLLAVPGPAVAAGALPIEEGFDSDSPADWSFYGNDSDSGQSHTAASNVSVGPTDEEPSLLLTRADGNQAGTALYTQSFSSSNGITAEFRYYSAEGSTPGADGFTFFLLNDSDVSGFDSTDIGDDGGALGYGDTGSGGITGGFIGVGFDEWGNFDEPSYAGSPGGEQEITIRGSTDAAEAPILANKSLTSHTVDGGWRRVRITVDPTVGSNQVEISVYVDFDEDGTYTEVFAPTTYDLTTIEENGGMPSNFKLGFSGSTGGSTNVHAIDALSVTEPVDLTTSVTSPPANAPYHAGETVEYTFDVTNNGPNSDSSVTLSPSVATDAAGLQNIEWDKGADGSFEVTNANSITVDLQSGETTSVTLRGTVGDDATDNLDHDVTATPSSSYNDPSPTDATASVSVDLNVAPSFTADEALASIDEDVESGSNGGNQLDSSEVFGDEFSDGDGDALGGIVVTGDAATSGEGTWQYSTDGGTNWYAVDDGSLSTSNGLLLSSATDLRFDPAADYNGDPGKLTVFAVDDSGSTTYTTGTTRQTYDTTTDGKSSVAATSSNTLGITVNAVNDAPAASATSNVTQLYAGDDVKFDATGSSDVDGDELTYTWDVDGDGSDEYTGATAIHEYTSSGTYTATLTVDDGTTTATDTLSIDVSSRSSGGTRDATPPTVDAGDDVTVAVGETVTFDGTGSSDASGIDQYQWDFDGDGTYDATGETADERFDEIGTYEVTLKVTDSSGNSDTDTVVVKVVEESSTTTTPEGEGDTTPEGEGGTTPEGEGSTPEGEDTTPTESGVSDGGEPDTAATPTPTQGSGFGFGALVAVVALLAAALLAVRRD